MLMGKVIISNWKMNPVSITAAVKLAASCKKSIGRAGHTEVVVCPPALYLSDLGEEFSGGKISLGAQDAFWEKTGAYTGEISAVQMDSLGVRYVIIGHSERRSMGESNLLISRKLLAVLKEGMVAILCVGENSRDEHGEFLSTIKRQLEESLAGIPRRYFLNLVVAYEPLWAISTHASGTESPEDMLQMSIFIRKTLGGICGKDLAVGVPIIYGGSVDEENVGGYISLGGADGVLVGKASLSAETFGKIVNSVN
mgnify:CR=1 FL=1